MPARVPGGVMDNIVSDETENRCPKEGTQSEGPDPGSPDESGPPRTVPVLGWGLGVWGFLIATVALAASETTGLW